MRKKLFHAFSTFSMGGAQSRFIQLANAFGEEFEHVVMAMDGNFTAASQLGPEVPWEPLQLAVKRGAGLANRSSFRRILKQIQPDTVFTYNFGAIEWAAANLPRIARHFHVEDGFGPQEIQSQLKRRVWLRRAVIGCGHARLIVPSITLANLAKSWWVPAARCHYIPNGVSFDREVVIRSALLHPPRITIGTVAGLRPEKNLHRLIKACARLQSVHNLRLLVMGDGSERPALLALAASLGIADKVVFTGHVNNPRQRMLEIDLFALSSNTEQLPLAMLDAMALGIPVASTCVGDVPHILRNIAPDALSAADDDDFTAMLGRVLTLQASWPEWAKAGLFLVESRYRQDDMLASWHKVFNGQHSRAESSDFVD